MLVLYNILDIIFNFQAEKSEVLTLFGFFTVVGN